MRAARRFAIGCVVILVLGCGTLDGQPIETGGAGSGGASSSTSATPASTATSAATGSADGESSAGSAGSGEAFDCGCEGLGAGERCLRFLNACDRPVWAGASGSTVPADSFGSEVRLDPGECVAVSFRSVVGGRAWGGTACDTGDCASNGASGSGTLAQFDISEDGPSLYNLSLVDGFNLPVQLRPTGAISSDGDCRAVRCDASLDAVCPEALRRFGEDGELAYCESICDACGSCEACTDCANLDAEACLPCSAVAEVCCSEQACETNEYTTLWKNVCPDVLTHAADGPYVGCDQHSGLDLTFCP